MWYEDIKDDPLKFMQEIYRFLEVDYKFIPDDLEEIFEFDYNKDPSIKQLKLTDLERKNWLKFYLPYTRELSKLCQKDLSHWEI